MKSMNNNSILNTPIPVPSSLFSDPEFQSFADSVRAQTRASYLARFSPFSDSAAAAPPSARAHLLAAFENTSLDNNSGINISSAIEKQLIQFTERQANSNKNSDQKKKSNRKFNSNAADDNNSTGPQSYFDLSTIFPSAPSIKIRFADLPRPVKPAIIDPLDSLAALRHSWDSRLKFELRSVAQRVNRPLWQIRTELLAASIESAKKIFAIRFVYTCEDLLETLLNSSPSVPFTVPVPIPFNFRSSASPADFSPPPVAVKYLNDFQLLRFQFDCPDISSIRHRYSLLDRRVARNIGFDDSLLGVADSFIKEKHRIGDELLAKYRKAKENHPDEMNEILSSIRDYCSTGCSAALRPRVWPILLECETDMENSTYYDSLIASVQKYDFLTDSLTLFDVQETSDTDEFFIFQDSLQEIMLAFSRDAAIPRLAKIPVNTAPLAAESMEAKKVASPSRRNVSPPVVDSIPPSSVIPFHRQSMLAAPICFLFNSPRSGYFVFRSLYCRHFCRLHSLTSFTDSIIRLATFAHRLLLNSSSIGIPPRRSSVFSAQNPAFNSAPKKPINPRIDARINNVSIGIQLLTHMNSIGFSFLSLVFPWIFSCFSGYLTISEVLTLWDRLIAYDSMELLSVLCAAIAVRERESILKARTAAELTEFFRDLRNIQVIPTIQDFLFARSSTATAPSTKSEKQIS